MFAVNIEQYGENNAPLTNASSEDIGLCVVDTYVCFVVIFFNLNHILLHFTLSKAFEYSTKHR